MATLQQLAAALKNADAAGDTEGARKLAAAYRAMQTQAPAAPATDSATLVTTNRGDTKELAVPPPGLTPGSREYADWAAKAAMSGKALPQVGPAPLKAGEVPPDTSLPAQIMAGTAAAADALPIVGPAALKGLEAMRGAVQHMTPEQVAAETQANEAANPTAATIGRTTGEIAPFVLAGATPVISSVLGMDAALSLPTNMALGALSQAGISRADSAIRGTPDADQNALIAAGAGALGPIAGKVVGTGIEKAQGLLKGLVAPASRADDILANTARADLAAGRGMTPADEASAALNSQPVINADRLGPNAQVLARTAANLDPTAKAGLTDALNSRFATQNDRITNFVNRLTGGQSNALKTAANVDATARTANAKNYLAAYNDPRAAGVLTTPVDPANPGAGDVLVPEIHQLMGAPEFQQAINKSVQTGKTDAALHGFPPVENPFVFDNTTNTYDWAPNAKLPSAQFWDQVQRNLASTAGMAARRGDNAGAARAWQLRGQLNTALDTALPPFAAARSGAAAAFGAQDALEAGQKFVNMPAPQVPAAIAAHAKFSPAEQKLFATGFANDLIAKVSAPGSDSANMINRIFGSPQARQQVATALGPVAPDAPQQLENFMRVENIMQGTNNTVNRGSTTAAQLAAMGGLGAAAGGATGGVTGGGDPLDPTSWNWGKIASGASEGALGGAALSQLGKFGAKALGAKINGHVMQTIAQKLASNDPAVITQVVKNASRSPQASAAIRAIQHGVSLATRGATAGLAAQQPQAAQ